MFSVGYSGHISGWQSDGPVSNGLTLTGHAYEPEMYLLVLHDCVPAARPSLLTGCVYVCGHEAVALSALSTYICQIQALTNQTPTLRYSITRLPEDQTLTL